MYESASAGFCFWMRCQAISKPLIEPCTNCIVGVEHMHPFARGVADAIVEISDYPNISLLAVKLYPAAADFRDDGFRIIRVRAIIDDRDLHFPRARILTQNAQERLAKVTGAIVDRYHYRPKRPLNICRLRVDARWDQARSSNSAYAHIGTTMHHACVATASALSGRVLDPVRDREVVTKLGQNRSGAAS